MGRIMKFVVAVGAVVAIVGAFLPLSKSTAQAAAAAGTLSKRLGMGGFFSNLNGSLFDVSKIGGSQVWIVYGTLALLGLAALFAFFGIFRRYGRGLAIGSFLAAAPPAFLMGVGLSQAGSFGGAGMGLLLLLAGSGLAVLGALLTLFSPERAEA